MSPRLVLADNYDQTLALSVAEAAAARDIDADARFIRALEARGKLDRAVEFLPGDAEIQKLENDKKGLTRPELAVLMAYAKLDLDAEILDSALPDDPAFAPTLAAYFPQQAAETFAAELPPASPQARNHLHHPRQPHRQSGGAGVRRPHEGNVGRQRRGSGARLCGGGRRLRAGGAQDPHRRAGRQDRGPDADRALHRDRGNPAPAGTCGSSPMSRPRTIWRERSRSTAPASRRLRAEHKEFISPEQAQEAEARIARFAAPGVPDELARDIGLLPLMGVAPEIAQLARTTGHGMAPVAALYFGVGAQLGLDRLRLLAARISASEHWDRLAIRRLVDDLFAAQRALSQSLLAKLPATATADDARKALEAWARAHAEALERTRSFLGALETTGELSIAKLTLANSQIHKLADI